MTVFEKMKYAQIQKDGNSPYDFLEAARRSMMEQRPEETMTVNLKTEVKRK